MNTILGLTLKSAVRDPFLLFWSMMLPIGGTIGLGIFIQQSGYPLRIMTGMMAAAVLFYAFTTTIFAVLGQRRRGVYRLLRGTPMPLWQYICAVSGAWTLISLLCAGLVWGTGSVSFGLPFSWGSLLMIVPTVVVTALGYVFFSFFVASLCRTEAHASMISNLVTLPLMFCSDAFYSLEGAPGWIQTLSRFNPFQWFVEALRGSLLLNVTDWLTSMGGLLGVALAALLVAVRTFRYADR